MTERAYRGREPRAPMDAANLLRVVGHLEAEGIDVWLDGGWGVDALLGQETREHDDLDLVAELRHSHRIVEVLGDLSSRTNVTDLSVHDYGGVEWLGTRHHIHWDHPDDVAARIRELS
jgi:hypothetical protein